jgi:hypothetical protein
MPIRSASVIWIALANVRADDDLHRIVEAGRKRSKSTTRRHAARKEMQTHVAAAAPQAVLSGRLKDKWPRAK